MLREGGFIIKPSPECVQPRRPTNAVLLFKKLKQGKYDTEFQFYEDAEKRWNPLGDPFRISITVREESKIDIPV